ncbi:MAG: PD-(D/E)XK nuclease family protein [Maribacter sp.]
MQSFIEYVVEKAILKYDNITTQCIFILPSKRASLFLKKAISKSKGQTTLSPEIYSIEEFIENISGLITANSTTQIFELYAAYQKIGDYEKESFDAFLKWGQTLLQDFNEIDRHLVDASQLYQNIAAIQEVNHWSLSPDKTEMIENYLHFWKHLESIYEEFNSNLKKKRLGHQGLIYKSAVQNLNSYIQKEKKSHLFIGFNALNTAEIQIIQTVLKEPNSSIYWDIDTYFLEDQIHDASHFIRKYQATWDILKKKPLQGVSTNYLTEKNINIIGVPKNISQVNYVGNLIADIHTKSPEHLKNTALILGNENLLNPLLNAIPQDISTVNITMGQKLETTTMASFFLNLIDFHEIKTPKGWFHKNFLHLLTHSYTSLLLKSIDLSTDNIVKTIKTNNWSYIGPEQINILLPTKQQKTLLLLSEVKSPLDLINQFLELIQQFRIIPSVSKDSLLMEQLYKFFTIFNQLKDLCTNYSFITNLKSLKHLYSQLITVETLDYQGDPVEGLQIMGMLESRLLDFETVILTSVNEGILPSGKSNNSFIPFDLKTKHGLPTYKEKDAVYTYHFYRLLQRAKNIYLIYNTEPDVLEGGERSRLITQLLTDENRTDITESIAAPKIHIRNEGKKTIVKTESLSQLIKRKGTKGFSPSSLSNYIRNPISFYKQNLLNIDEVEEVEETLAANTFGTIVHDSLEELYTPFVGKYLTAECLDDAKKQTALVVKRNFDKSFKEGNLSTGKNYLSYHVILKYIHNFLDAELLEIKNHQIQIVALEKELKVSLSIEGLDFPIVLKGKLDRIDIYDGITRIIDYKTGKVEKRNVEILDWSVVIEDYQYSKAFQLLCYAFMFSKSIPQEQKTIQAGIISMKNFTDGTLLFAKKESARGPKNHLIDKDILLDFEQMLYQLISEICNSEIPFIEKEV